MKRSAETDPWLEWRVQRALLGARFHWWRGGIAPRSLLMRLRRVLGRQVEPGELVRMARASLVYRSLRNLDALYPDKLKFLNKPRLDPGSLLLVPSLLTSVALNSWLSNHGMRTDDVRSCQAPLDRPAESERRIAAILAEAAGRGIAVEGIHLIRTGRRRLRFATPVTILAAGEGIDGQAASRAAQFLDDCLRLNPAQYDWLDEGAK